MKTSDRIAALLVGLLFVGLVGGMSWLLDPRSEPTRRATSHQTGLANP